MDIAKYIGLFLLKNKYCCLQGLGNLEIKKNASKHNGTELTGSAYYAKLNPVGSIDDSFPNFIANNEQVSIAKASNEISEFIKSAKEKMAEGGSIEIPSIGAYMMKNNQLHFELDPAFSLPTANIMFPVAEAPKQEVSNGSKSGDETSKESFSSYNNYNKQRTVNWNIIAFWGVVIIIGGSIIGWSISYFMKQRQPESVPVIENLVPPITQEPIVDSTMIDSAAMNTTAPVNPNDTPEFNFIIKEYKALAPAQKKEKQLLSYGYAVNIITRDSLTYYVVNTVKIPEADTTKIKDSLTKLLNPAGVTILR